MSNPVLNEGMFQKASYVSSTDRMTTNGAVMKTLILGLVFSIAAFLVYGYLDANIQDNQIPFIPYVVVPSIAAFVVALIISFKPATAPFLSVIYAVLQGVAVAAISFVFNAAYNGIVLEAVVCTMIVFFLMLFLFRAGIIRATEKFKAVMVTVLSAITVFYLVMFVISFFGITPSWFYGSSLISIGISVAVIIAAALSLILDFDFIVEGENSGLPKYMEWYAAFGLIVTIIWLYLEILRLLAKLKDR